MPIQFKKGDRVRFARRFLRGTGQFTGPDAPTSWGPFARGTVEWTDDTDRPRQRVSVAWDDDHESRVINSNLDYA